MISSQMGCFFPNFTVCSTVVWEVTQVLKLLHASVADAVVKLDDVMNPSFCFDFLTAHIFPAYFGQVCRFAKARECTPCHDGCPTLILNARIIEMVVSFAPQMCGIGVAGGGASQLGGAPGLSATPSFSVRIIPTFNNGYIFHVVSNLLLLFPPPSFCFPSPSNPSAIPLFIRYGRCSLAQRCPSRFR